MLNQSLMGRIKCRREKKPLVTATPNNKNPWYCKKTKSLWIYLMICFTSVENGRQALRTSYAWQRTSTAAPCLRGRSWGGSDAHPVGKDAWNGVRMGKFWFSDNISENLAITFCWKGPRTRDRLIWSHWSKFITVSLVRSWDCNLFPFLGKSVGMCLHSSPTVPNIVANAKAMSTP